LCRLCLRRRPNGMRGEGSSDALESPVETRELTGEFAAVHLGVAREFALVAEARDASLASVAVVQEGGERRNGSQHLCDL